MSWVCFEAPGEVLVLNFDGIFVFGVGVLAFWRTMLSRSTYQSLRSSSWRNVKLDSHGADLEVDELVLEMVQWFM